MSSEKKRVRWDSDFTKFTSQAAWGGAQRDMAVVRDKLGCKHDVSEFYSPPRVVKMARKLSRKHCRGKAMEIINDQKPLFLVFLFP